MAYYRLSKVVKMRREAMGHERCEYDAEGPSGMTVLRLEQGKVRVKESTYRRLSKAMGQEESTRQGILQTNDFSELRFIRFLYFSIFRWANFYCIACRCGYQYGL